MRGQERFDVIQEVGFLLPSLVANVLDFSVDTLGDMHCFQG